MILFTSGFPKAGKTTIAKKLIKHFGRLVLHINPEDYYPDDFEELAAEDRMDIATTAWEMSLEKATKSICALPNKALIVFDTCCSKSLHMRPLFMNAKLRGHKVAMVYVDTPLKKRIERSKNDKLADLDHRYAISFKETIPILRALSDEFIIMGNGSDDLSELDKYIDIVAEKVKNIRSA